MNKELNGSFFVSFMSAETINLFSLKVCFSENENLGMWTRATETGFTHRIQGMEQKPSGTGDMRDEIDTLVKENAKSKMFLTKLPENWDAMKYQT